MAFKLNRVSHPKNQILLRLYSLSQQNLEYSFGYAREECPGHVALYKEFGSVEVTVFSVVNNGQESEYEPRYWDYYIIIPKTVEEATALVDDYIAKSIRRHLMMRVCSLLEDSYEVDYHEFMEIADEAHKKHTIKKVHES